ncbi:uncharacterized membrane-anchored protein YhcB (DUF1043 family) [Bacillus mesophilus]|nr:uncharacterized membrane-anchored protein YhcB (DUF1043 family) [Bacillus mesophilus]
MLNLGGLIFQLFAASLIIIPIVIILVLVRSNRKKKRNAQELSKKMNEIESKLEQLSEEKR